MHCVCPFRPLSLDSVKSTNKHLYHLVDLAVNDKPFSADVFDQLARSKTDLSVNKCVTNWKLKNMKVIESKKTYNLLKLFISSLLTN